MSVAPNSKSKLSGTDTHALGGTLTTTVGTTVGNVGDQIGTISTGDSLDHLIGTMVVTTTEAVNLVILRFSIRATNDSNIEIREGTTEIATVDGSGTGTRTINIVLEDVSVGSHTYNCSTIFDTQFYQYWISGSVLYGAPVNIDDTHDLAGSNTQSSHEDHILP